MKFSISKLPVKITPCPIAEAVVELRFEPAHSPELIPSLMLAEFVKDFPEFERLPINDMPQFFRDSDLNLRFAPLNTLSTNKTRLQFGPRSLAIVSFEPYLGWSHYSAIIADVLNRIEILGLVKTCVRLGLRFVNFFEDIDIFQHTKVSIGLGENNLVGNKNALRSEFDFRSFTCTSLIANAQNINGKQGSIIDLDISKTFETDYKAQSFMREINEAHITEKYIFFSLLRDEFLAKFNPEYSNAH